MSIDRTLHVATGNQGKLRDFAVAAAQMGEDWQIAMLPGLATISAPDETGTTFEENARLKAIYYSRHAPGLLVIADDSGLAVDALGGAPGVYSARYADRLAFALTGSADPAGGAQDSTSTDARNNACLLAQLSHVEGQSRTARYHCVLAVARDGEVHATADGTVEGEILAAPRGTSGFGYDPLFLLLGYRRTMAELDAETRLVLSHRGAALRTLLAELKP